MVIVNCAPAVCIYCAAGGHET